MRRSAEDAVRKDLETRIVLLSGPRQVGKTTLSKSLFEGCEYFNHDLAEHRVALKERSWDRRAEIVVFDELHKMKNWKTWLKGVFDVEGARPRLLVTGSARLDVARKMGDSLAGRFFAHRLHPFDVKELRGQIPAKECFDALLRFGGFPEPFLAGTERAYKRWRRAHIDIILRQDLLDLEAIRDVQAVETLVEMLRRRVGSTVSMSGLARDLERDAKTVKRWLTLLENLYVVFKVTPYHRDIARSLLKEPKFYFYDTGLVEDPGARLENLVACALKKELDRRCDQEGDAARLCFLRTKDGRELDFAAVIEDRVTAIFEVKTSDAVASRAFSHFGPVLKSAKKLQLVQNLGRETTTADGVQIRSLVPWLETVEMG